VGRDAANGQLVGGHLPDLIERRPPLLRTQGSRQVDGGWHGAPADNTPAARSRIGTTPSPQSPPDRPDSRPPTAPPPSASPRSRRLPQPQCPLPSASCPGAAPAPPDRTARRPAPGGLPNSCTATSRGSDGLVDNTRLRIGAATVCKRSYARKRISRQKRLADFRTAGKGHEML
jgi:hypothetical protein